MVKSVKVQTMEYDVSDSLKHAIAKYEEAVLSITGSYPKLYHVDTPFI